MEESEDREREIQKAARELDHQAGEMRHRTEELGTEIDAVRQEFRRKRNDPDTPGLPAEPEGQGDESDPSLEAAPGHAPDSEDRPEDAEKSDSDPDRE